MSNTEKLTLTHPEVQAAKVRWEVSRNKHRGGRPRKQNLSFEEWFERFNEGLTFTAIASDIGVSRERVKQIYDIHFFELFGGNSGQDRYRSKTHKQRLIIARRAEETLFKNPTFRIIAKQAEKAGYAVAAVPHHQDGRLTGTVRTSFLSINHRPCSIHVCSKVTTTSVGGRLYAKFNLALNTLKKVEAVVFRIVVEGYAEQTFVVPSELLQTRIFNRLSERKYRQILIPVERPLTNKKAHACIDFWKYEGAWHLLRN